MEKIIFAFPGNESLAEKVAEHHHSPQGAVSFRNFPDGELYIRILSDVQNKHVIIICSLNQPNEKFLRLYFFCNIARQLNCKKISLISPYLAYMRQDKVFHPGEGVTSNYFAKLLSETVDELYTIDPHLHRITNLGKIYSIKTQVYHAADKIAAWVSNNITNALLIGPDSESEQWLSDISQKSNAPYLILNKIRKGDEEVEISLPNIEAYKNHQPILIDDIISSGKTMIETIKHLKRLKVPAPFCIGIHAVFAEPIYQRLLDEGAAAIITCNTINHPSNQIDISELFKVN